MGLVVRAWGGRWSALPRLVGWGGDIGKAAVDSWPWTHASGCPFEAGGRQKRESPPWVGDESPLPAKLPFYPKDFVGKMIIFRFKNEVCFLL